MFRKPPALRRGDRVAIIAPAGPFDLESFEAGLGPLEQRYAVQLDARLFERYRYLAGDDARRLAELRSALSDPAIKAVFCARGGYGTMRLLPRLAPDGAVGAETFASGPGNIDVPEHASGAFATGGPSAPDSPSAADTPSVASRPPVADGTPAAGGSLAPAALFASGLKPLVGFSDITGLHLWLQQQGIVSIHGPVVTQLGHQPEAVREGLFNLLESSSPRLPLRGSHTYVGGTIEGPLLGGNLAVFSRLIGTPFLPSLEGAVLLLEDVGERPYRLDRMWTHLTLAGVFRQVRGIVLGSFTACEEWDADYTSEQVLRSLAEETGLPCAAGFPIGHGNLNEAVALGVRVRLDAAAQRLEFLEPAVEG